MAGAASINKGRTREPLGEPLLQYSGRLGSEPSEDRKRVLGLDFVDELPAGLDLAVDLAGELDRLVTRFRSGDDVGEGAGNAVALVSEPVGKVARLGERLAFDAYFPRRVAAREKLLLGVGLWGFVVPPVLAVEPALGDETRRCEACVVQLLLHDAAGLLGLHSGGGV